MTIQQMNLNANFADANPVIVRRVREMNEAPVFCGNCGAECQPVIYWQGNKALCRDCYKIEVNGDV